MEVADVWRNGLCLATNLSECLPNSYAIFMNVFRKKLKQYCLLTPSSFSQLTDTSNETEPNLTRNKILNLFTKSIEMEALKLLNMCGTMELERNVSLFLSAEYKESSTLLSVRSLFVLRWKKRVDS